MSWTTLCQHLFYLRFPLIAGLMLFALGPVAAWTDAESMLGNTLLLNNWVQAAVLMAVCLLAATLVAALCHVTSINAADRFSIEPWTLSSSFAVRRIWSTTKVLIWLALGCMLPVVAAAYSSTHGVIDTQALIGGLFAGAVVFFVGNVLWEQTPLGRDSVCWSAILGLEDPPEPRGSLKRDHPLLAFRFRLAQCLAKQRWFTVRGYLRKVRGSDDREVSEFAPGQLEIMYVMGGLGVTYFSIYLAMIHQHVMPGPDDWLSTPFYTVLLLMLVSSLVSGCAFFFDYYRVPVSLVIVVWLFFTSITPPLREHTFETIELRPAERLQRLTVLETFNDRRLFPTVKAGQRVLVVVTAPGGGIHAAAWTARVLTGLHEHYGNDFAHSLGLISAVSGGSVGTMYYADSFENLVAAMDGADLRRFQQQAQSVNRNARGSSLETVGWGMAFTDLCRATIPFLPLFEADRGNLLERRWSNLRTDNAPPEKVEEPTLGKWQRKVREHKMPVVVFNATEVETGRRVLLSPVVGPTSKHEHINLLRALDFRRDVKVVTAARLSATFPYVSPVAKPDDLGVSGIGHVADGGYADNEGVMTAVDWIDCLHQAYSDRPKAERPFDRIVLLRLVHTVATPPVAEHGHRPKVKSGGLDASGWLFSVFGPVQTMLQVRTASQLERGDLEVHLAGHDQLRRALQTIHHLNAALPEANRLSSSGVGDRTELTAGIADPLQVEVIELQFDPVDPTVEPPLSWKLSPLQDRAYDAAWHKLIKDGRLQSLDKYFARRKQINSVRPLPPSAPSKH